MRSALAILTAIACLTVFSPANAQTSIDVDALTKKEKVAREKAKALESERLKVRKDVSALKKDLAKTARQTQTIESELTALELETANLTARAVSLNTQISADHAQYSELLAALQRLEANPPPTLALTPRDAKRAADAGLLMATLSDPVSYTHLTLPTKA